MSLKPEEQRQVVPDCVLLFEGSQVEQVLLSAAVHVLQVESHAAHVAIELSNVPS